MRHQTGYEALVVASFVYWSVVSATAWAAEPPASTDATAIFSSIDANPDLKAWHNTWRTFVPDLDGAAFRANSSESFPRRDAHRVIVTEGSDLWDFGHWSAVVPSPDGAHAIGWASEVGEPDSQAYLIDLKTREAVRVASCGTPCRYDLGAWLDSKRFVVVGTNENYRPYPSGHNLRIDLFALDAGTVKGFEGPLISYAQLNQFRRLWHRWLAKRFPLSRSFKADSWEEP